MAALLRLCELPHVHGVSGTQVPIILILIDHHTAGMLSR